MSLKAVEKDWWVTLVLKALFSLPMCQHFTFKGGTSLSKAWKLIERFSEDIDIALAPEAFGREYKKSPSNSYVKALKKEGCTYTTHTIKDALHKQLIAMGVPADLVTIDSDEVNPIMPDKDPQTLFVRYPSLYDPNLYIAEAVKVEFGVRSLKEPFATTPIQSIIAEVFPNPIYSETPFLVTAVEPRKTFMEKLFLLHEKFSIVRDDVLIQERQSRHLSDLSSMTRLGIAQQVFDDPNLYAVLLEHRRCYTR
jgi:Nucleotidyl transferase AbiEii toxin, Type IV TA system